MFETDEAIRDDLEPLEDIDEALRSELASLTMAGQTIAARIDGFIDMLEDGDQAESDGTP